MPTDLDRFQALAIRLADAAKPIALRYFRNDPDTETKSDASPVTIADRESERIMREMIRAAFQGSPPVTHTVDTPYSATRERIEFRVTLSPP